jgi:hypothetical protein
MEVSGIVSQPLYFRKRVSRTPGAGGWVGPRAGLEARVKSIASAGNQTTVPQLTRPKSSQYSALKTLANHQTTCCRLHTDRNLQAMPDRDSHSTARPPVPVLHRHIRYDQTVRRSAHLSALCGQRSRSATVSARIHSTTGRHNSCRVTLTLELL